MGRAPSGLSALALFLLLSRLWRRPVNAQGSPPTELCDVSLALSLKAPHVVEHGLGVDAENLSGVRSVPLHLVEHLDHVDVAEPVERYPSSELYALIENPDVMFQGVGIHSFFTDQLRRPFLYSTLLPSGRCCQNWNVKEFPERQPSPNVSGGSVKVTASQSATVLI